MVIATYFVDDSWQLRKLIIGFKNISDHKNTTIYKVLLEFLAEWDIKKVFCITVDNATTNTSATKKFKDEFKLDGNDAMVLNGDFLAFKVCYSYLELDCEGRFA